MTNQFLQEFVSAVLSSIKRYAGGMSPQQAIISGFSDNFSPVQLLGIAGQQDVKYNPTARRRLTEGARNSTVVAEIVAQGKDSPYTELQVYGLTATITNASGKNYKIRSIGSMSTHISGKASAVTLTDPVWLSFTENYFCVSTKWFVLFPAIVLQENGESITDAYEADATSPLEAIKEASSGGEISVIPLGEFVGKPFYDNGTIRYVCSFTVDSTQIVQTLAAKIRQCEAQETLVPSVTAVMAVRTEDDGVAVTWDRMRRETLYYQPKSGLPFLL